MVAMPAVEQPLYSEEEQILQSFLELDTPAGFKAELIEGEIVVTPPPSGSHETVFALINRQFMRKSAVELDLAGNKGLAVPRGHYIPDGTISPVGHFEDADSWADPTGVLLVFEITSSNPTKDREAKRRGYAAAKIPCYLLIDRSDRSVTLFTDPAEGDYRAHSQVPFGKPLDLPAPFSFALDTGPLQ
ncbi:Uma2 family endonuclease [Kitasatospora sp. MAP5-34]|uniref:Uma2 family endonuclease n=1 Tax=Kitasatospora sp. MAP5-34 TaxID=3035102 RepID=UPI002475A09A|nr:Uma2 family endonuclease [Kitasatospora sp. MAP5-34]MDH6578072.1 Uma2 family endonuclease [Kitasatospora sp. MAP5-34]